MELESAIPPHLQVERTLSSKLPANYQPPFPAYTSRWPAHIKGLVFAIFGVQQQDAQSGSKSVERLISFVKDTQSEALPRHWELASYTDNQGYHTHTVMGYWETEEAFEQWSIETGFKVWWESLDPAEQMCGWFKEIFSPAIDHFETVFSSCAADEGASYMKDSMSGPISEHVYWGSMRDRMPASQVSELQGDTWPSDKMDSQVPADTASRDTLNSRVKVRGRKNLTVIRSGQDWGDTLPKERKLYLETMHPVLVVGMDFLRDHGEEVGCISNRFMSVSKGENAQQSIDKTFGLGYFDDMASLEKWSKSHKTHLDIFGRFLQYAKELDNEISLKLFHEVLVLKPEQQVFEYVGCHAKTGMLAAL